MHESTEAVTVQEVRKQACQNQYSTNAKEENNGCMSKPELHETYRCAQKGGCIEGETTSTKVVLEDKGLTMPMAVVWWHIRVST